MPSRAGRGHDTSDVKCNVPHDGITGVYGKHQHFGACTHRIYDAYKVMFGAVVSTSIKERYNYSNVITGSPKGTKS